MSSSESQEAIETSIKLVGEKPVIKGKQIKKDVKSNRKAPAIKMTTQMRKLLNSRVDDQLLNKLTANLEHAKEPIVVQEIMTKNHRLVNLGVTLQQHVKRAQRIPVNRIDLLRHTADHLRQPMSAIRALKRKDQ